MSRSIEISISTPVIDNPLEAPESSRKENNFGAFAYGERSVQLFEKELARRQADGEVSSEEKEGLLEEYFGPNRDGILTAIFDLEPGEDDSLRRYKAAAKAFFIKTFRFDDLKSEAAGALGVDAEALSVDQAAQGFRDKRIGLELFYRLLKKHIELFYEKVERVTPLVEKFKGEFLAAMAAAIEKGGLPLTEDQLRERLGRDKISFTETLDMPDLGRHIGGYSYISVDLSEKRLKHSVFHEQTHAAAGHSIDPSTGRSPEGRQEQKSGLAVVMQLSDQEPMRARFEWLNEAVTERVTLQLLEQGGESLDEGIYGPERNVLNSLIEGGVSEELFLRAYFDGHETGLGRMSELPSWAALISRMEEVGRAKGATIIELSNLFR